MGVPPIFIHTFIVLLIFCWTSLERLYVTVIYVVVFFFGQVRRKLSCLYQKLLY